MPYEAEFDAFFSDESTSEEIAFPANTLTLAVEKELDSFFKAQRTDRASDPLAFWHINKTFYPFLGSLARKYLCPPCSSTASESEFKIGKLIHQDRLSLLPRNLETLVFLKYNLRATQYPLTLPQVPFDFIPPNEKQYEMVLDSDENDEDQEAYL